MLGWKYIQKRSGYIQCPFPDCGTKQLKCNITKEFFHCYACGRGGNYYSIYAELMGIEAANGKTASQIAREEILERLGQTPERINSEETKQEPESCKKRSKREIDQVYRSLLRHTSLKVVHKKALLERGLTEEQIEKFAFRSVDNSRSISICRLIQKDGLNLEGIPGFYYDSKNNCWNMNTKGKDGYFCMATDEYGFIQGFQIRLDEPKDGQKYLWLSSKNKCKGMTSGSPCAYFGPKECKTLILVDGILKALVCFCLLKNNEDVGFLGVAGVNNHKNMTFMVKKLVAKRGVQKIINAYDMDEFGPKLCQHNHKKKCLSCDKFVSHYKTCDCEYKLKKASGLKNGSEKVQEISKRLEIPYIRYTWDIGEDGIWQENFKGFDDFLLKGEIYEK